MEVMPESVTSEKSAGTSLPMAGGAESLEQRTKETNLPGPSTVEVVEIDQGQIKSTVKPKMTLKMH